MHKKARLILTLGLLAAAAPLLSACYTMRGAGEDMQAAGKGITNSSDSHTNYKP